MLNGAMRTTAAALTACIFLNFEAAASPLASPWVEAHGAKARLIAGAATPGGSGEARVVAGVAVSMSQGWKTYWRAPGDSGGLPPHFDWSGSVNLASAKVHYPAPRRFKDAVGDSIGYSGSVVFPVEIRPEDPAKPVELRLVFSYGICREICVPAEAGMSLPIPPSVTVPESPEVIAALATVPRRADERQPHDPELKSGEARLEGDRPRLVLEVEFPEAAASGDMFIEEPDGAYVPLPVRVAEQGDTVRFQVDLTQGAEPEELRGKTLRVTMVSDAGQSEAYWTVK